MEHTFTTPEPVELHVELGKGDLTVTASDVAETRVELSGPHADEVSVEQDGSRITVVAPRQRIGFFSDGEPAVRVTATVPTGSSLVTRTGSADQVARGTFATVRLKAGSGDVRVEQVTGVAVVDTGSGDVEIDAVEGDLRVKSGSGDVEVGRTGGTVGISTGSGDVSLGTTGETSVLKSGSGDLTVGRSTADLSLSTASGTLHVGAQTRGGVTAKNVSGDVHIGIPSGIPVWTDVSTLTGRVGSDLQGAGQPGDGEDHIEVRAKSVSGDIVLKQL